MLELPNEAEQNAARIRIHAELRSGELLAALQKGYGPGRGKTSSDAKSLFAEAKDAAGISSDQASKWQQLAENPKAVRQYLKDEEKVPTTAGPPAGRATFRCRYTPRSTPTTCSSQRGSGRQAATAADIRDAARPRAAAQRQRTRR